ncbi:McrB family protein [Streptococcus cristatus]|jgi:GTPase subunit of restriction endonuclease|uniref:AAA family ATPase n=1 Tax=Streptococcus cristatus TaxID=45634 RepID=A0AAW5WQ31_STRCR|nr:AAA family ATPase [Streptococcus cristatus]MCY7222381.1 AAA family ATPase [Streptococcus cristatus]
MSKEKIAKIIDDVKKDHSDIGWIQVERDFRIRHLKEDDYLIDGLKEKLKKSYKENKKYMVNGIEGIEDYIVITKFPQEPTIGNIEFTKEGKKGEFKKYREEKKSSFKIEQDEFICYFFRVINDKGLEDLVELTKFLNSLNDTNDTISINDDKKGEDISDMNEEMKYRLPSVNTILYGPPGTGKTYNSIKYAVDTVDEDFNQDGSKKFENYVERFNDLKTSGQIAFTTFHQSYGYEEFIEGIKPFLGKRGVRRGRSDLNYKISDGVFKEFCKRAASDKSNKYVFIIDEINRGNISKIFGELITLIEDSKRDGEEEAMSVTLPYSQEEFSVPKNVYILGTMNTADRSIALMDTALRRRFEFIEMMPKEKLLDIAIDNVNVKQMLKAMNQRIEVLYDREHTLGHAFFMPLKNKEKETINQLASIFKNKIIPLLQEYFYEDYEKIMLVLGIDPQNTDPNKFISVKSNGALFNNSLDIDLNPTYQINEKAFQTPDNYMTIYDGASSSGEADESTDSDS